VKRSSHNQIADELLLRIFRGDYPSGADLPAERQLAIDLDVDRTTLRMALKQLERMNLLEARHGSGIRVLDWRAGGGLDVLAAMFSLESLPLEGSFIVEALDFWLDMVATMTAKATVRMSLDEMRSVEHLLDAAIAADTAEDMVPAVMAVQDRIAELSGSVFFHMLSNSTRTVRARISGLLDETLDGPEGFVALRQLLRNAALTRPTEEVARAATLAVLRKLTTRLRERLLYGVPASRDSRRRPKGRSRAGGRRRSRRRDRGAA
jgi:GntR family transcriptional repressor for pyruvate dehydrogenase complex